MELVNKKQKRTERGKEKRCKRQPVRNANTATREINRRGQIVIPATQV